MKPNYEKPIALALGKAAKGSGQCAVGSVVAGSTYADCETGRCGPYGCDCQVGRASCAAGGSDACGFPGSAGIC